MTAFCSSDLYSVFDAAFIGVFAAVTGTESVSENAM